MPGGELNNQGHDDNGKAIRVFSQVKDAFSILCCSPLRQASTGTTEAEQKAYRH